ncbi:MAG TPA: patatin-like phospholipase family protein [Thermoanaerobaculia bacterium]|nr:patatin-like phospholipase family protein [Thermoanaerobaculia bacterium]
MASEPGQTVPNRRMRALAFGGGGFDTIMQLGVAHALLVTQGKAPDHVVGISAGAINAAALAEILQAGGDQSEPGRAAMKARRLREFLDAYLEFPALLLNSVLPDTFEINAKTPLKPVELPIHFDEERRSRADAVRSKAGLVSLFNDLLSVRIPISAFTRITRRILGFVQAPELPRPIPPRDTIFWNAAGLWLILVRHVLAFSEVFGRLLNAAIVGADRNLRRLFGSGLLKFAGAQHWHRLETLVKWILGEETANAAAIIQSRTIWYLLHLAGRLTLAVLLFTGALLVPVRLISPPERTVKAVQSIAVPEFSNGNLDALEKTLQPFRNGIAIPAPTIEGMTGALKAVASGGARVIVTALAVVANFIIHHRASIGIPLVLLGGSILIECVTTFETALAIFAIAVVVMDFYSKHIYDKVLPFVVALIGLGIVRYSKVLKGRVLKYYEIGDGLFSSDALRADLIRYFDPDYYGKPRLDAIIDAALGKCHRSEDPAPQDPRTKISKYALDPVAQIHVGIVAADVATGHLECISEEHALVDALLAANAVAPFFPAQSLENEPSASFRQWFKHLLKRSDGELDRRWLVDGLNVSNEPMQPLIASLRARYDAAPLAFDDVKSVDIYPVSDLPVDESALPTGSTPETLVEVGLRALELKQFRDATMERRLTRLYTKALPSDRAFYRVESPDEKRTFVHAGVFPIELGQPSRINRRLLTGTKAGRYRTMLRETVADGCRASIEAMLPKTIAEQTAADVSTWLGALTVDGDIPVDDAVAIRSSASFPVNLLSAQPKPARAPGWVVLEIDGRALTIHVDDFRNLTAAGTPQCLGVVRRHLNGNALLPGSDEALGPGLAEICRHCRLYRKIPDGWSAEDEKQSEEPPDPATLQRLRFLPERASWPAWPRQGEPDDVADRELPKARKPYETYEWPQAQWPPAPAQPVVSLLFGGGVFRGVFHMGVTNALNEAGIQPHLVAGSSVGAIIAAMIAAVFKEEGPARRRRIYDLSATFLAIDRLVLTDRLADFVRRFTLRAAETEFSARDLDRVLRRFDQDGAKIYNHRARRVAAGLERLFYFSPFELFEVVKALRLQQTSVVIRELTGDLEEMLERGGLSQEILGAEPLSLLITEHVLKHLPHGPQALFDDFLQPPNPIFFLATATNLSAGSLEILGAPYLQRGVSVENGLLASSAFPAVFRPRQSWEIFRETDVDDQYIDGGTIDNLPLDAVARFLDEAANHGKIEKRPPSAPHLLFTASLEVDHEIMAKGGRKVKEAANDCLELMKRASTFKYNRKIDEYASAQRRLRNIHDAFHGQGSWTPLDLHVLAVKPNWLCGTFGFHPMLGFRREKQARSIAHGCASTLMSLHMSSLKHPQWLEAWGASHLDFDPSAIRDDGMKKFPAPQKRDCGFCWFRNGRLCPYSRQATRGAGLPDREAEELDRIYRLCGEQKTHESRTSES